MDHQELGFRLGDTTVITVVEVLSASTNNLMRLFLTSIRQR